MLQGGCQYGTTRLSNPSIVTYFQGARYSLIVVPYMGAAGRELCRSAGVAWLDLAGNAEIHTSSLRIRVTGESNRFKRSGRPESIFAAGSARVARIFLMDVSRSWIQSEIANKTGLAAGYLSRLLPRYVEAGFLECT